MKMQKAALALVLLTLLLSAALPAQRFPLSDLAEEGCLPCQDTVQVLFVKKYFDTGRLLPEWKPVAGFDTVVSFEGRVVPASAEHSSCHISALDFSGYHYTHDLSFDAVPDSAYRHLCARRVYPKPGGGADTILQTALHCEWESGIASGNASNPLAAPMRGGGSAGFLTAGHSRREPLWTMPTIGDRVHLEGLWIWDRGHPPARTEIHPIRFMAITRQLPDLVAGASGDSVFATRTDIFASGDGGALMNNRPDRLPFARPVRMSGRVYRFRVQPCLPAPAPGTALAWRWLERPGHSFAGPVAVRPVVDEGGRAVLEVSIDWRDAPDAAIFARSLLCWWDAPLGKHPETRIHTYRVQLEAIDIHMRKEGVTRSEWRFFTDVGGQWLFQNEFLPVDDILAEGLAKTRKKRWPLGQVHVLHVPEGVAFRLFAGGWEADGMDKCFGEVLNDAAPCSPATRKALRKHLMPATPFGMSGCLDDVLGVAHQFPRGGSLPAHSSLLIHSTGHAEDYDYCGPNAGIQEDCFSLRVQVSHVVVR